MAQDIGDIHPFHRSEEEFHKWLYQHREPQDAPENIFSELVTINRQPFRTRG